MSSLTCYVPLALFGLFSTRHGRRAKRFVVIYSTLLAIGLGSTALHALLTAQAQGGDELPMLWFTAAAAFCALDIIFHRTKHKVASNIGRRIGSHCHSHLYWWKT